MRSLTLLLCLAIAGTAVAEAVSAAPSLPKAAENYQAAKAAAEKTKEDAAAMVEASQEKMEEMKEALAAAGEAHVEQSEAKVEAIQAKAEKAKEASTAFKENVKTTKAKVKALEEQQAKLDATIEGTEEKKTELKEKAKEAKEAEAAEKAKAAEASPEAAKAVGKKKADAAKEGADPEVELNTALLKLDGDINKAKSKKLEVADQHKQAEMAADEAETISKDMKKEAEALEKKAEAGTATVVAVSNTMKPKEAVKESKTMKKLKVVDAKIAKNMKKMGAAVIKDDIKLATFKMEENKKKAAAEQANIDALKATIAPKAVKENEGQSKSETNKLEKKLQTGDKGERKAAEVELEGKDNAKNEEMLEKAKGSGKSNNELDREAQAATDAAHVGELMWKHDIARVNDAAKKVASLKRLSASDAEGKVKLEELLREAQADHDSKIKVAEVQEAKFRVLSKTATRSKIKTTLAATVGTKTVSTEIKKLAKAKDEQDKDEIEGVGDKTAAKLAVADAKKEAVKAEDQEKKAVAKVNKIKEQDKEALDAAVSSIESSKAIEKKADDTDATMKAKESKYEGMVKAKQAETKAAEAEAGKMGKAALEIAKESAAIEANADDGEEPAHVRAAAMAQRLFRVANAMAEKANAAKKKMTSAAAEKATAAAVAKFEKQTATPEELGESQPEPLTPEAAHPGNKVLGQQKTHMWSPGTAGQKAAMRARAIQRLKKQDAAYVKKLTSGELGAGKKAQKAFKYKSVSKANKLANDVIKAAVHKHFSKGTFAPKEEKGERLIQLNT